ncbi:MAG: nucleotidyl transferase AbiEii/AbiGii toxin family protein [Candidatus Berkiellales bacterium]
MNLFDHLVDEALKNRNELSILRIVVEKELLHHDILRILSKEGLLAGLTFMGGTCLRLCYGSNRLSEDLDFTGGADFSKKTLSHMAQTLTDSLATKYGLHVDVSQPKRGSGNVDTWVIKVQTRPGRKEIPTQRINIDICAIPSYQSKPMVLLNPYGVEMGTSGLILLAESREEIFADKIVAFTLRKNRIKYRDLWDMVWLHQNNIKLPIDLVFRKMKDHQYTSPNFLKLLNARKTALKVSLEHKREFLHEMHRFLPAEGVENTIEQSNYWEFLVNLIEDYCSLINKFT